MRNSNEVTHFPINILYFLALITAIGITFSAWFLFIQAFTSNPSPIASYFTYETDAETIEALLDEFEITDEEFREDAYRVFCNGHQFYDAGSIWRVCDHHGLSITLARFDPERGIAEVNWFLPEVGWRSSFADLNGVLRLPDGDILVAFYVSSLDRVGDFAGHYLYRIDLNGGATLLSEYDYQGELRGLMVGIDIVGDAIETVTPDTLDTISIRRIPLDGSEMTSRTVELDGCGAAEEDNNRDCQLEYAIYDAESSQWQFTFAEAEQPAEDAALQINIRTVTEAGTINSSSQIDVAPEYRLHGISEDNGFWISNRLLDVGVANLVERFYSRTAKFEMNTTTGEWQIITPPVPYEHQTSDAYYDGAYIYTQLPMLTDEGLITMPTVGGENLQTADANPENIYYTRIDNEWLEVQAEPELKIYPASESPETASVLAEAQSSIDYDLQYLLFPRLDGGYGFIGENEASYITLGANFERVDNMNALGRFVRLLGQYDARDEIANYIAPRELQVIAAVVITLFAIPIILVLMGIQSLRQKDAWFKGHLAIFINNSGKLALLYIVCFYFLRWYFFEVLHYL